MAQCWVISLLLAWLSSARSFIFTTSRNSRSVAYLNIRLSNSRGGSSGRDPARPSDTTTGMRRWQKNKRASVNPRKTPIAPRDTSEALEALKALRKDKAAIEADPNHARNLYEESIKFCLGGPCLVLLFFLLTMSTPHIALRYPPTTPP